MPKSITYGPPEPSSTLLGFRSRWITPAACTAVRAWAAQPMSWKTAGSGSGPNEVSASCSERPGTYCVASQGWAPLVSWSTTGTMW